MPAQQGGLCTICRAVPGTFVDHSHRTGQVRGILCFTCNKRAKSHSMQLCARGEKKGRRWSQAHSLDDKSSL
jgi:hypothetical protein